MSESAARHYGARRSALAEPLFRKFFPATCCATLGSWLVRFLFGWIAWELTHSALWVGLVAGALLLPTFLLSPLFGIVSDRIDPRNGLLVTVFVHGLVAVTAGLASLLNALSLPMLLFLAGLLGAATSAHTPIRLALVPRLVVRQALPSAIGLSAIIFNTSRILAPALGAWLVATMSTSIALFVAAVLFFCAIPFLWSINSATAKAPREPTGFFSELRAGFAYAASHRSIRLVLGLTLLNGLMGRTLLELLPALCGALLDGTAQSLATLSATGGVGAILGGLVVSRQDGNEQRLFGLVTWSLFGAALCLLGAQWLTGLLQFSALVLVLSMITTTVGTGTQALTQLTVDEHYRGRVLSIWTVLAMGAPALGAMVVGALADIQGFPLVLACCAVLALLLLTALVVVSRRDSVYP